MTEAVISIGLLVAAIPGPDPAWAIAAGLFAIAANINLLYHKEDKA